MIESIKLTSNSLNHVLVPVLPYLSPNLVSAILTRPLPSTPSWRTKLGKWVSKPISVIVLKAIFFILVVKEDTIVLFREQSWQPVKHLNSDYTWCRRVTQLLHSLSVLDHFCIILYRSIKCTLSIKCHQVVFHSLNGAYKDMWWKVCVRRLPNLDVNSHSLVTTPQHTSPKSSHHSNMDPFRW
jgi:hypothetical protein